MSNHEHPCTGCLIEASKLAVLIAEDRCPIYNAALAEHDFDTAIKMLQECTMVDVACPTQIFILQDTDTGDGDLQHDTPYAYFDEEDLYEKREKSDLIRLRQAIGETPTAHAWTIWG